MIVDDAARFLSLWPGLQPEDASPATARGVFMMSPRGMSLAMESASDCGYMDTAAVIDAERAMRQFGRLAALIESCGLEVKVFDGDPATPDCVFPNNVYATIPGRLIVGSMRHPLRRREAERADVRAWFGDQGYSIVDLSGCGGIAELTGNMVIDRSRRAGFCGMSSRVDDRGLEAMHEAFDLRLTFRFELDPSEYHTNVVMAVLAGRACVLQPDALCDDSAASALADAYPGRTLLIDAREKQDFVGNCIALSPGDLFMSERAVDALRPAGRAALESWGFELHSTNLDEIEKAGGSLRCMVGEIF